MKISNDLDAKKYVKSILTIISLIIFCNADGVAGDKLFSPGFDCKKAKTETEKLICSDDTLSRWDSMLQQQFKTALAASTLKERTKLIKDQSNWLRMRDRTCKASDAIDCLNELYQKRYDELNVIASKQISFDKFPEKDLQDIILSKFRGLPDGYIKLNKYEFVFPNTSHGGRIDLGIYYVNTKTKKMDQIIGGSPTIEGFFNNNKISWILIHTSDLSWGIEYEGYSAIIFDRHVSGKVEDLLSSEAYYEEDEKKDPCFKSGHKRYDFLNDILGYDLKEVTVDNSYDIIFHLKVKNCKIGKWHKKDQVYHIKPSINNDDNH
jgi:uncharacterized protein YecT (DUF1311 family)